MFFIDWLFIIAILVLAIVFLFPDVGPVLASMIDSLTSQLIK